MNLKQVLVEVLGEEKAKLFHSPASFMHFQCIAFDKIPLNVTYYPNADLFKKGDYVELLAHDDVYVFISPCPLGDQNDTSDLSKCVNWPFRVAIYEGADGPLETAPGSAPQNHRSFRFHQGRPARHGGRQGWQEGVAALPESGVGIGSCWDYW